MFYLSTIIGAVLLMLLRICDTACILSLGIAVVGITAMVYSVRHAKSVKEYIFLSCIMAVTFAVRVYGYIGKPAVDILTGLLIGLIMFVLFGLERLLKKYEKCVWYTLIFPVSYLLFMYFTETFKINMPFRMDIYFSGIPFFCQITSLLGIYFLDFLLAWTASVLVFFIDHRPSRQSCILASIYICTLCVVICFDCVHMNHMNTLEAKKTDTVRVALATGPYYGSFSDVSDAVLPLTDTLASLDQIIQDAAKKDAEILLLSEEAFCVNDIDEDLLIQEAEKKAVENNIHLLLAYEVDDTDGSEKGKYINKLCWISAEGEVIYEYTKHCLVPFVETSECVKGASNIETFNVSVHEKTLSVAAAICYDADFDLFMSYMDKNTDLLLLPTWDWSAIAENHLSVARLRAISNETTVVRSVYDGWNAVINSAGDILLCENTNDTGYENVLICDIPVKRNKADTDCSNSQP